MDSHELIKRALSAMEHSYSPYSGFRVGAALLTSDGQVYEGANIENAAYTPSVCAERTAIFKAVFDDTGSEGHRSFSKIAVVGGMDGVITSFTYPCGVCRQVMREFCVSDFTLVFFDGMTIKELTLNELMPYSFGPEYLSKGEVCL